MLTTQSRMRLTALTTGVWRKPQSREARLWLSPPGELEVATGGGGPPPSGVCPPRAEARNVLIAVAATRKGCRLMSPLGQSHGAVLCTGRDLSQLSRPSIAGNFGQSLPLSGSRPLARSLQKPGPLP